MRGDVGREAWESLRSQRVERLPMGLLVRREAAGRGDLAQVGVIGMGRDRSARDEEQRVNAAFTVTQSPCQRAAIELFRLQIYDIVARTWRLGAPIPEPWSRDWVVKGLVVDGKFFVMHLQKGIGLHITPATLVYDPPSDTWTRESDEPWREESWGIDNACVHNGRLVVFTRNGVFERATDGSLSSCEDRWPEERWHYVSWSVCESVLLG